jgi:hypothetical protein
MNSLNGLHYPQCSLDMFTGYQDHFCIIWDSPVHLGGSGMLSFSYGSYEKNLCAFVA